jgi:hypothetical protein
MRGSNSSRAKAQADRTGKEAALGIKICSTPCSTAQRKARKMGLFLKGGDAGDRDAHASDFAAITNEPLDDNEGRERDTL